MCSHRSICLSDDSISKILNEDHTEALIREDVVQHIHVFCRERCNDHSEIIHRIPGTSRRGSMMIGIASRHISPFRKTASKREFATGSSPSSQACGSSTCHQNRCVEGVANSSTGDQDAVADA